MGGLGSYVSYPSGFGTGLRIGTQFLLEGLVTIVVAGIAYFTMHDVRFLAFPRSVS